MSRVPRFASSSQESAQAKSLRLAVRLTPMQRHLVVRAGLARWLDLPVPWQPCPGRQKAAACALASAEYGLVEPVPEFLGAFQLTQLGEFVAGIWLTAVLCDTEPLPSHFYRPTSYR